MTFHESALVWQNHSVEPRYNPIAKGHWNEFPEAVDETNGTVIINPGSKDLVGVSAVHHSSYRSCVHPNLTGPQNIHHIKFDNQPSQLVEVTNKAIMPRHLVRWHLMNDPKISFSVRVIPAPTRGVCFWYLIFSTPLVCYLVMQAIHISIH